MLVFVGGRDLQPHACIRGVNRFSEVIIDNFVTCDGIRPRRYGWVGVGIAELRGIGRGVSEVLEIDIVRCTIYGRGRIIPQCTGFISVNILEDVCHCFHPIGDAADASYIGQRGRVSAVGVGAVV